MANTLDIEIKQGETFQRLLSFTDSLNAPIDITSWTFAGQIRQTYSSTTILASFTFDNTGLPNNQIYMKLSAVQTSAITVPKASSYERTITNYTYDVEASQPIVVERILQGTANISPEVTK